MHEFLGSPNVAAALLASALVAALSAAVGYFVVLRGLSFAGHAVTDIGLTGGAGALLAGLPPLAGLLAFSIGAASAVGAIGDRARERDVATGLVLSLALGIGALFLHLQTQSANGQSALLFGSIFSIDASLSRTIAIVGALALCALAAIARPLLFASVAPEAAFVAGVRVRALGYAFLVLMAVAVAETAQIVGVLISTALLVGPAATATALVRGPFAAIAVAAALAVLEAWAGIVLAYASFGWTHGAHSWPVSFFVAVLALLAYAAAASLRALKTA